MSSTLTPLFPSSIKGVINLLITLNFTAYGLWSQVNLSVRVWCKFSGISSCRVIIVNLPWTIKRAVTPSPPGICGVKQPGPSPSACEIRAKRYFGRGREKYLTRVPLARGLCSLREEHAERNSPFHPGPLMSLPSNMPER